jgi:hypothetical protein
MNDLPISPVGPVTAIVSTLSILPENAGTNVLSERQ